jgi:hypothetical protein
MLTKKIANFSDDLLNTVLGILGEAKKCPADCECEKCEAEDEMKEGAMPTADEPTEANKKTAQKIRDMMAKEKKPVKEDSEQIDEISSDMAHRYLKGKRERDYDISPDGKSSKLKKPQSFDKMNKDMKSTVRALKTIEKAKKANEDVEHTNCGTPDCCGQCDAAEPINEISKGTLGRYINKAKDSIDMASYRQGHKEAHGSSSKPLEKKLTKRHKGISTAVNKLTKEASGDQHIEVTHAVTGQKKKVPVHPDNAFKALNHYKSLSSTKSARIVSEDAEQIDELSKGTMGRYINKAATKMGSQGVTAGLKIAADEKSSKNFKDMGKREKGIKLAVNKLTKEEQDFIDSLNNDMFEGADYLETDLKKRKKNNDQAVKDMKKMGSPMKNPHFGEEAEQIDELSKKTLGSYIKKASGAEQPKNVMSPKNVPLTKIAAYQGDSETGHFGSRFNQATYDKAERLRKNRSQGITRAADKLAKEEVEITEARGRPKKAGAKDFTIHPKTKEKLMHNNPEHMKKIELLQKNKVLEKPKVEAGQHIMNQLRKAKTSMLGGSKINFTHGDSKEVSGTHAAKILTKYAGMKPDEKENFQKFVGHSHENLMKHV